MTSKQMIFDLYKKFFDQRAVLTEAPELTMDINRLTIDTFDFRLAESEVISLVSYLLGVQNVQGTSVFELLKIIQKGYEDQPFWKALLLDYVDFINKKNAEHLKEYGAEVGHKAYLVFNDIFQEEQQRKELVRTYARVIKKENFAIDAERLMISYFNMYRKDSKKAWETLITNPAYFSPIITTDQNGHTLLTPEEAIAENKKIARFLKSVRV